MASRAWLLLAALLVAHLWASSALTPRGPLSVDECTYQLMARGAVAGTLSAWNGYEEFPSVELAFVTLKRRAGALYPIPPSLYAGLAWPFYRALGFAGLFWMNALAFVAVLALTGWLAQRLFGDRRLSLGAVLILGLATYFWEYSQAVWPHALGTLAVLGGVAAGWSALTAGSERRAFAAAALAGGVLGLGIGVRLDVAFAVPCVAIPFGFVPRTRARAVLGLALGLLPGLALLAFMNRLKFDDVWPFSYGPNRAAAGDWTGYLPVAALGLVPVCAAMLAQRPAAVGWLRAHTRLALSATAVAVLLLLALPEVRALLLRLARGTSALLFDLRPLHLNAARPALSRTDDGAYVYFGHLKKAWLQSLPYLGLLLLPLCAALRGHAERGRLALLALVPAAYLAAFAAFSWDGGMSLNLRYLTPALPSVAVLSAWALRELWPGGAGPAAWLGAVASVAVFGALSLTRGPDPASHEVSVLDAPLALAAALTLAVAWLVARGPAAGASLRAGVRGLTAAALVWAGLVAFFYDYPAVRWLRGYNADLSRLAGEVVEDDSILFTTHPDPFCGLLERDRVRIALPRRDRFRDLRPLVDFHQAAGRAVYGAFPPALWELIGHRAWLEGLEVEVLREHPIFSLRRIRSPD